MYKCVLSYFDSSTGVSPIVQKLLYRIQGKWRDKATRYMRDNSVVYPPFTAFCRVILALVQCQITQASFMTTMQQKTNATPKLVILVRHQWLDVLRLN